MNRNFYPALFLLVLLAALSSCAATPTSSPIDGTWSFNMNSPFGALNATVTLAADGDALTGSFDLGNGRIWPIEDGVSSGNEISFRLDRDSSPMVYDMSASIDGDSIAGIARAMGTEVPWAMTRDS